MAGGNDATEGTEFRRLRLIHPPISCPISLTKRAADP